MWSIVLKFASFTNMFFTSLCGTLGTLRCEDGKSKTGMAMDKGNFCESHCFTEDKMLKMCTFWYRTATSITWAKCFSEHQ